MRQYNDDDDDEDGDVNGSLRAGLLLVFDVNELGPAAVVAAAAAAAAAY